jgi:3-deoxy-D-manno-octulosonic acid kinase
METVGINAAAAAAQAMNEAAQKTTRSGAILCDAAIVAQVEADWFDPDHWRGHGGAQAPNGGRGAAWLVQTPAGAAVLRHYRRGGALARLAGDRYWWNGAERSRPFAEFRLLQWLRAQTLPVPRPLAARYQRDGLFYRADLLTGLIPAAETLAQRLAGGTLDAACMAAVGTTIARFHAAGAWHADLNAHNVLLNASGVHLIDFDRGRRRAPGAWTAQNLARLRRSLRKLGAAGQDEAAFERDLWQPLQQAYSAATTQLARRGAGGGNPT